MLPAVETITGVTVAIVMFLACRGMPAAWNMDGKQGRGAC